MSKINARTNVRGLFIPYIRPESAHLVKQTVEALLGNVLWITFSNKVDNNGKAYMSAIIRIDSWLPTEFAYEFRHNLLSGVSLLTFSAPFYWKVLEEHTFKNQRLEDIRIEDEHASLCEELYTTESELNTYEGCLLESETQLLHETIKAYSDASEPSVVVVDSVEEFNRIFSTQTTVSAHYHLHGFTIENFNKLQLIPSEASSEAEILPSSVETCKTFCASVNDLGRVDFNERNNTLQLLALLIQSKTLFTELIGERLRLEYELKETSEEGDNVVEFPSKCLITDTKYESFHNKQVIQMSRVISSNIATLNNYEQVNMYLYMIKTKISQITNINHIIRQMIKTKQKQRLGK